MLNKVILMGRLCADPDFRQTPSGVAVCRIRLAIDLRFRNALKLPHLMPDGTGIAFHQRFHCPTVISRQEHKLLIR